MLTEDEKRQLELAEAIVSSESFMWLMNGSNHVDIHLATLKSAYRAWCDKSGGYIRYNHLWQHLEEK